MLALGARLNLEFDHARYYRSVPPHRPEMLVELAAVDRFGRLLGTASTVVLIDSGADTSMLNADLAPQLGIDLSHAPTGRVLGIGGETIIRHADVLMRLCSRWIRVPVMFDPDRDIGLLGREGAFDALRLAFVHQHHLMLASQEG